MCAQLGFIEKIIEVAFVFCFVVSFFNPIFLFKYY